MPKFYSIKYFFQVALEMKKKINKIKETKREKREKNAKKKGKITNNFVGAWNADTVCAGRERESGTD